MGRRKEGVRVRVRLGVGGAIRNYCGTIDKRRLRGCTTEDSRRRFFVSVRVSSPFPPLSRLLCLSILLHFGLPISSFFLLWHEPGRKTDSDPQTRQYVTFGTAVPRNTFVIPCYVEWRIPSNSVYFCGCDKPTVGGIILFQVHTISASSPRLNVTSRCFARSY